MNLTAIRKSIINVLTVLVTVTPWVLKALDEPPFQGTATATVVSSLLGLVGVLTHYKVPNVTTDPVVAASSSVKLVSGRHEKP